ncbi:MAG: CDP-diacylglycerol--glycerol-3-phosphate 3-phosphatidyltransferase [Candidatus Izemoplasmatales bacterium]|jgi:CDP-diacylglycerol--glycerol-3-phosphate 3-phosphatidyltransferase|nr:CDP-diacylglycerol--glycerol-3-phosphate 3-phosphatidyltransferase [Candidatus Izemoplasmatales bacterium]
MSLPNKLTMMRVILIPVMVSVYLLRDFLFGQSLWIMGVIFIVAAFTDYLDGYIARKQNIVTTFGKFMDPLADKLLVMTALLIIADLYSSGMTRMWMPFWVPLIVLSRELIVTSIRLIAVGEGKIIAASKLGKYKTASTMIAITVYLFFIPLNIWVFNIIGWVMMGVAILLTIISGVDYLIKNKEIIFQTK